MSEVHYVYAIVAYGTSTPTGLSGFDGNLITIIPHRQLAAATSLVDPSGLQPTAAAVLMHEKVVETLQESTPLLPVRFGAVFTDADGVAAALARQYDTLLADLNRLGDKVEFGLTVLWPTTGEEKAEDEPVSQKLDSRIASHAGGPGAQYLRARVMEERRAAALRTEAGAVADLLEAALGPFALETRRLILPTPRIAVRAAYLLHPMKIGSFQEEFERSRMSHPHLRFLLNGPWPPYSFVSISPSNHQASSAGEPRPAGQVAEEEAIHGQCKH